MYDFIILFLLAMDSILDSASDSVRGGWRLSGVEERIFAGTVDLMRESKSLKPIDWSISLLSSSLGPTVDGA